jgi:serine/threonine-protein kinase
LEDLDPKIGTKVSERYRLDERLAAGGMGVVYKGLDLQRKKPVAVKFVHEAFAGIPTLVKRFQREVNAMSRVSHDNLVSIIDSGVSGGVPYLVMDFHEGTSLGDMLEKGKLPPAEAIDYAKQILSGVEHAHISGVVHRDLKPDNILIVDGKQVKILDFGLAKMISEEGAGTQLTNTGFALGTPGYMAPEQARGGDTDERTDVYAVGVILYHMVAGKKPFVAESPMAVLRMHMDDPPLPLRKLLKVSPSLDSAVLRALEKDPARRWQSAAEFARALGETAEAKGETIPELPRTVAERRTKRRAPPRKWMYLVLLAIVVGGGTFAWSTLSRREKQDVKKNVTDSVKTAVKTVEQPVKTAVKNIEQPVKTVVHEVAKLIEPSPQPRDDEEDDDSALPKEDSPGAKLEASQPAEPPPAKPSIDQAAKLLGAGKIDSAIKMLYVVRRTSPKSPAVPLLLGHAYFRKLWRYDGIREYGNALQLRPSLKWDKQLVKNVVYSLDSKETRSARNLLRSRVGTAALPELRRATREKNPRLQQKAAQVAAEISRRRR